MAKNIIFCADGTWNSPNDVPSADKVTSSNVFKLFTFLEGRMIAGTKTEDITGDILEREKVLKSDDGKTLQIAKYINGVGNSEHKLQNLLGGGFGFGVITRVIRGYTFISRNFEIGDNIYIVGFSRGAYTARALAGLIASQGLLKNNYTRGDETAYRLATLAWSKYMESVHADFAAEITTALATSLEKFKSFIRGENLTESDLIPTNIAAVAVWDTVGAMGIPEVDPTKKQIHDAFKFANTTLSSKVNKGFHAIAIDEQRLMFTPTLWDDDRDRITQVVFPGVHADVGGGYPTTNNESGLSDGALQWMITNLRNEGVKFFDSEISKINPNPTAPAHKEWPKLTTDIGLRTSITGRHFSAHSSVALRRNATGVVHDYKKSPKVMTKYNPINWP